MAEHPELYLSLLSGRRGGVWNLSAEQRCDNVGSHLSGRPFLNDPDRVMDLLDTLAAICVRNEKGEVFFVSMAMETNAVTLFVASNGIIPTAVTSHLKQVRAHLKALKGGISTAEFESSPDPNKTQSRADGELVLQKAIYEFSYNKFRRRFLKRAPMILKEYDTILERMKNSYDITDDINSLNQTRRLLQKIQPILQHDKPPKDVFLHNLIRVIDVMSMGWRSRLKIVGEESILSRWDNVIGKSGIPDI